MKVRYTPRDATKQILRAHRSGSVKTEILVVRFQEYEMHLNRDQKAV